jgi:hypothetical protein
MSVPIDGSSLSSSVGGDDVLRAARLNTCNIEGLRKESLACGRGRMEVASAEAVMFAGRRNAEALLKVDECERLCARNAAAE